MDLPIRMAVKINFFNLTETSKKLLNFKSFDFGTKMGDRNRKDVWLKIPAKKMAWLQ